MNRILYHIVRENMPLECPSKPSIAGGRGVGWIPAAIWAFILFSVLFGFAERVFGDTVPIVGPL